MDKTTLTVQNLASTYSDWFEKLIRDDEFETYILIDGHPPELLTLVRDAHGEKLPDDWCYQFIYESLISISESNDPESPEFEPDAYYYSLLKWLSSRTDRGSYMDEYVEEFGAPQPFDTMALIGYGQVKEKQEVYSSVLSSLQELVEKEEISD